MKRLVIGLLAHVDSGKTTLAEGLLYTAGEIRKIGRVDHKDAHLDTHAIEKERGITVFSKQAVLHLDNAEITLLDTPGHVDFSTETERTLHVLDAAVLVISGSEGVQSHTETLWRLLKRYRVPTFIFVNKMDLAGADAFALLKALEQKISEHCIDFTKPHDEAFYESLALCSESLMNEFLESGSTADETVARAVKNREVFPCFFGTALRLKQVDTLLQGLLSYFPQQEENAAFGAKVFKIAEDESKTRLTYMKITGGSLKVRALLGGTDEKGEPWSEKITRLRVYSGSKFTEIEEAKAGTVVAAVGLTKTFAGEGLGTEQNAKGLVTEPLFTYRTVFPEGTDLNKAYVNLSRLEEEDPALHVVWNPVLKEIHVQLMGEVQTEVLQSIIKERFQTDVSFDQGSIAYKETIENKVEGIGHYEPLRHYAEVHLILEPLPRGSGIVLATDCSTDDLDLNWQRLILTHLAEKTHVGVLAGLPITDIKITLASGRAHEKHTEGGDFRQATYRAVRQGLMSAKSILLEPWYDFCLEVPQTAVGRAMNDLNFMGALFSPPEMTDENTVICGRAPVRTMQNYSAKVAAYSGGKGRLSCSFGGYEPCKIADEIIEKIGYHAESDLENTADSVFCAHGAGFTVKWNEVPQFAHLQSALAPEPKEEISAQQVRRYVQHLAADKELMQIFERTYGKIRRAENLVLQTPKTAHKEKSYSSKTPTIEGPEYLLVDGYNVIFAWDELKEIAEHSLEHARERLTDILCSYRAFRECELILVFDAYKVKNNPGEVSKVHGIYVVYTKEAETADMYIEKTTHRLGKKHRVRVVTSDGLEQLIILGSGALRVPAAAFLDEVQAVRKSVDEYLKSEPQE